MTFSFWKAGEPNNWDDNEDKVQVYSYSQGSSDHFERPQKDNRPVSPIKATINLIPRTLVNGMIKLKPKNMLSYVLTNKTDH